MNSEDNGNHAQNSTHLSLSGYEVDITETSEEQDLLDWSGYLGVDWKWK